MTERVSVIVLCYRREHLLPSALASVVAQSRPPDEIIVVDNASSELARNVAAGFSGVEYVASPGNMGFAGGMNLGMRRATGDWIWMTEDDVFAEPDCLQKLLDYAGSHSDAGLIGPMMLRHGKGEISAVGCRIRLGALFYWESIGALTPDDGRWKEPVNVDFLPGASILARRSLLLELGGFREDFWMYMEDAELAMRVRLRGLRVVVVPAARVSHVDPPPGPTPRHIAYHKAKNLVAIYLLHAPVVVLPAFILRYGLASAVRAVATGAMSIHLRAWFWALRNLRRILTDRRAYRKRPGPQAADPGAPDQ